MEYVVSKWNKELEIIRGKKLGDFKRREVVK
jgi:hypothetical protein